jgi:hypothetical protein
MRTELGSTPAILQIWSGPTSCWRSSLSDTAHRGALPSDARCP